MTWNLILNYDIRYTLWLPFPPTIQCGGLYLCNHLEEGEGNDLLRDINHLVEADADAGGVVVEAGQQGGGEGHVRAGFPLGVHRRVAILHIDFARLKLGKVP